MTMAATAREGRPDGGEFRHVKAAGDAKPEPAAKTALHSPTLPWLPYQRPRGIGPRMNNAGTRFMLI
jgi:hypothetical protein